ncbi:MAG: HDOD domain-containing protein [Candidatus Latescibacteria bacterium]|nr:HDOD domain-containing protein [Candidatus Latescibacterota bacterium]
MNDKSDDFQKNTWKPVRADNIDREIVSRYHEILEYLPALPGHVFELLTSISDSESSSKNIADITSSDPVLASKILKIVNSAYYSLPDKIDNLQLAIVLLGYEEVRNIALRCSVHNIIGTGGDFKGYDVRHLWKHSFLVSVCSGLLEKKHDLDREGVLLTLGLLHDIGKYVLFNAAIIMRKKGMKIGDISNDSARSYMLKHEEEMFGVNHAVMGSMIAKKWGLSERLYTVLEYHHYPSFFGLETIPEKYVRDVAVVSISDYIINILTGKNQLPMPSQVFFDILGLEPIKGNVISDGLRNKLEKAQDMLTYLK